MNILGLKERSILHVTMRLEDLGQSIRILSEIIVSPPQLSLGSQEEMYYPNLLTDYMPGIISWFFLIIKICPDLASER